MKFFKSPSGIKLWMEKVGEKIWVHFKGRTFVFAGEKEPLEYRKNSNVHKQTYLISPIPGRVLSIKVKAGEQVKEGDSLMVVESMKIEHALKASQSTKIKSVLVTEGQSVESNEKLMIFG